MAKLRGFNQNFNTYLTATHTSPLHKSPKKTIKRKSVSVGSSGSDDYDVNDPWLADSDEEEEGDDLIPYYPGTNEIIPDEKLRKGKSKVLDTELDIEWRDRHGNLYSTKETDAVLDIHKSKVNKAGLEKATQPIHKIIADRFKPRVAEEKTFFVTGDSVSVQSMFDPFDGSYAHIIIRKPDGTIRYQLRGEEISDARLEPVPNPFALRPADPPIAPRPEVPVVSGITLASNLIKRKQKPAAPPLVLPTMNPNYL